MDILVPLLKKERKPRRILLEARRVCCGETWSGNPRACLGGLLYLFQMNFSGIPVSRFQSLTDYFALYRRQNNPYAPSCASPEPEIII